MDRIQLLSTALLAGGVYASFLVLLRVFYPTVAGYCWQVLIGPAVAARWPTLVQNTDTARLSYLGTEPDHPFVWSWGLFPPPVNELTQGLRDGLLLGVFIALTPEIFNAGFLTLLLAFVFVRSAWRISKAEGAWRTDAALWSGKEVLMFVCAIQAVNVTRLL